MKRIVHLEFIRTTDSSESYYQDMWKVVELDHTPITILTGLRALTVDREWEVEVIPLVKEREWLKSLKVFGIDKEDGKKIIHRLGHTVKRV